MRRLFAILALLPLAASALSPAVFSQLLWATGGSPAYPADAFVMRFSVPANDYPIVVSFINVGSYSGTIDFGDGSGEKAVTAYNDADRSNKYALAGTYDVQLRGTFGRLDLDAVAATKSNVIGVVQWGTATWSDALRSMFEGCSPATLYPAGPVTVPWATSLYMAWYNSKVVDPPSCDGLSGITDMTYAWRDCASATSMPSLAGMTNVTTLDSAWRGCTMVKSLPAIDHMTKLAGVQIARAWKNCSVATSFPSISALTNLTALGYLHATDGDGAWSGCNSATVLPEVSALTKVTNLCYTWYNCNSLILPPDVSALTNVNTLYRTWQGCYAATSFPSVAAMTNVTWLHGTWRDCWLATNMPEVATLTKVTSLTNTWYGCTNVAVFPEVSALTNVAGLLRETWRQTGAGTLPEVSALTKVTGLYYTWLQSKAANFPAVNALTNVTLADSAWWNCTAGTNFPDIDGLGRLTSTLSAWTGNTNTFEIPAFPDANTNLVDCRAMFEGCIRMSGTANTNLWNTNNYPNLTNYAQAFKGCTNLSNYADIPAGWK